MIDRIIIRNFKSLRAVDLSLGRMNLFIGANASGKSNFLDVFRVLQGIGSGLTISEVLDGGSKKVNGKVWQGIRGGSFGAPFVGSQNSREVTIQAQGTLEAPISKRWDFSITFSAVDGRVGRESLKVDTETLYSIEGMMVPHMAMLASEIRAHQHVRPRTADLDEIGDLKDISRDLNHIDSATNVVTGRQLLYQDSLKQISQLELTVAVAQSLANVQCVDPSLHFLRESSDEFRVQRMGDYGENFAALIHTICEDEKAKDSYLSWMREFSTRTVDDAGAPVASPGKTSFMLTEGGMTYDASVLGDGTLRFAAIVAAFFQPDMPELMLFDEIETSVHASRLRLLVELLGNRAGCSATQVMATTHSPVVLEWLRDTDLAKTFFCNRDQDTGESTIRPLIDVPRSRESIKNRHFFDILVEGWPELIS